VSNDPTNSVKALKEDCTKRDESMRAPHTSWIG